ncbi:hypothetical protein [Paenibacillus pinistramenti]|uniref:hypothetical protein n=1 Tax=Paenibacillus pinistramenti TaxID=1768003 RepID=UPI0011098F79|nr:hypothetical protein [Paenibacillus pinistramenti]
MANGKASGKASEWEHWKAQLRELEAAEDLINLAEERRDESLVPHRELAEALQRIEPAGSRKNRKAAEDGMTSAALLLAADGRDAADRVFGSLIAEGDPVLVEGPSDPELLEALRRAGAAVLQVESGEAGSAAVTLERAGAGVKPKLAVLAPGAGISGAGGGSAALLEAAARLGVTVVVYNGPGLPWRGSSAPERAALLQGPRSGASGVIEIGSMEPHLPPLGWVRAAGTGAEALAQAGCAAPAPGSEQVLLHLLAGAAGFSPAAYETRLRREYAARRGLMLSKLSGPSWRGTAVLPSGDRHLWLRLPAGLSGTALLRAALLEGAAFLPGPLAFAEPPEAADRLIRLTCTGYGSSRLAEGLDRIAAALSAFTARLDQGGD